MAAQCAAPCEGRKVRPRSSASTNSWRVRLSSEGPAPIRLGGCGDGLGVVGADMVGAISGGTISGGAIPGGTGAIGTEPAGAVAAGAISLGTFGSTDPQRGLDSRPLLDVAGRSPKRRFDWKTGSVRNASGRLSAAGAASSLQERTGSIDRRAGFRWKQWFG